MIFNMQSGGAGLKHATGTFVGDNTYSVSVTGIEFLPTYVMIQGSAAKNCLQMLSLNANGKATVACFLPNYSGGGQVNIACNVSLSGTTVTITHGYNATDAVFSSSNTYTYDFFG